MLTVLDALQCCHSESVFCSKVLVALQASFSLRLDNASKFPYRHPAL